MEEKNLENSENLKDELESAFTSGNSENIDDVTSGEKDIIKENIEKEETKKEEDDIKKDELNSDTVQKEDSLSNNFVLSKEDIKQDVCCFSSDNEGKKNDINVNQEYNSNIDSFEYVKTRRGGRKNVKSKKTLLLVAGTVASAAVLFLAAVGGVALIGGGTPFRNNSNSAGVTITVPPSSDNVKENKNEVNNLGNSQSGLKNASTVQGATSVATVCENVMPSIVAVNCTVVKKGQGMFGEFNNYESQGSGSGIIIGQNSDNTQLLIVTNNHVVEDAKSVEVVFCDDKSVKATVKGTDSSADLAVLSVNISDMENATKEEVRIATIGDSNEAKVGETAIAIGNALGYGQSVTVGIISALNREISIEDCSMKLIQTDAAINPGNSGGALINSKGELIGINSVKYVSEDTEGIGYAIPISTAVPIINELMNYEEIPDEKQGYLGIIGTSISSAYAFTTDIDGVIVKKIGDKTPAQKGGLVVGDIITKFDGRNVSSMEDIQAVLQKKNGGSIVEVVVKRLNNGKYEEKTLEITLGARGDYYDR